MRSVSFWNTICGSTRTVFRVLFSLPLVAVVILFSSCADEQISGNDPVATIGEYVITVDDFRREYELTTAFNRAGFENIAERKQAILDNQIQNILFAIAGREKGFDKSTEVEDVISYYESHAVIRELYRDVIQSQIRITESELRDAFVLSGQKISLRQFLFANEDDAWKHYGRVKEGYSFEELALQGARSEQELQHLLEPVEFRWGDLDEQLEQVAFGLEINQVSTPVQSRLGYHIIQLVHRTESLIRTENDFQARKESLKKIIARRREASLAREYLNSLARSEQPGIIGSALTDLARRANELVAAESSEVPVPLHQQVFIVERGISELKNVEIIKSGKNGLTIHELLLKLKKLPPSERFDLTRTGSIAKGVAALIRDEYLASDGYARGLEMAPSVQEEVTQRRNEIAAGLMRQVVLDSIQVSSSAVSEYYKANVQMYQIPATVRVREVMVRSRATADSLFALVDSGSHNLQSVANHYSVRAWAKEKGGDLGFFAKGAFGSLGESAFQAKKGELMGPIPITFGGVVSGYSVYRVLDRVDVETPPFSEIEGRVYDDALRDKRSQVLNDFLDKVRIRNTVSVDYALLSEIHTTDDIGTGLPMDMVAVRRR